MSRKSIEPLQLTGNETVADMIDNVYAASGFNGRRLAEAAQLYSRMLNGDTTVCLTLSGAMTPIGMSGVLISLIERGFIDCIICTGANAYHDLHRAFDFPMYQGHWMVDDNELAKQGIARIYDTFIHDHDTLMATDQVILEAVKSLPSDEPLSTARLHDAIGTFTLEHSPHADKSFVAAAAKHAVPVYTSSPGDSSIGMNLIVPYLFGKGIRIDPVLDVIETTALIRAATENGAIEVGGGSPKNFYMQTQPTLHQILRDESKGGHDYFIQLTTDAPHWGGLSGATPGESKSWGKIKDATVNNVVCYSCASLTFPLLAQYVLQRNTPRTLKRLYDQRTDLVDQMVAASKDNDDLMADVRRFYGQPDS